MMTIVRMEEEAQGSEQEVMMALDDLARQGARRMIRAALKVEVEAYQQRHRDARDAGGRALVVRTGRRSPAA